MKRVDNIRNPRNRDLNAALNILRLLKTQLEAGKGHHKKSRR